MSKIVKIYGERNTGTNYLQQLIKLNFDVLLLQGVVPIYVDMVSYFIRWIFPALCKRHHLNERIKDDYFKLTFSKNLGWKHTLISSDLIDNLTKYPNTVFFITLTKNPYSWLLSFYNRPYYSQRKFEDFEQFLVKPWEAVGRENSLKDFINPIEMWNLKNKSYIKLNEKFPTENIRYEDLLANPENIIESLSEHLNIPKKHETVKNVKQSTKEKKKDFYYYRNYYLKEVWRKKLSSKATTIINNYLDENVLKYFDYIKIEM